MLMRFFDDYAARYAPYKGGAWCYEDGCLYRGLALLHTATGEARWLHHLRRLVDAQIGPDGTLAGFSLADYNIDNILSGRALLYLHWETGEARYLAAADGLIAQLRSHPRTRSGVYWHKQRYPWQVWLDGLYMGLPFQIEYGLHAGDGALVDDALVQLATALSLTRCPETGLHAHGYDESRQQAWADPVTGRSAAHWGRALGWLAMALVDVAELTGADAPKKAAAQLLDRIVALRIPGGLWLQVVDQPRLAGNFPETSASAMFVYAILKVRRLGIRDAGVMADLVGALCTYALEVQQGGRAVRMRDICEVAGLGRFKGRYRDGSAQYYVSERCVNDDPKGVGPLMAAMAEAATQGISAEGRAPMPTGRMA